MKTFLICIFAFVTSFKGNAQVITTYAGTPPYWGSFGDGGFATNAGLTFPSCIAIDIKGSVYIGDDFNKYIRVIDTNGIISRVAGTSVFASSGDGGPASIASLNGVVYLASDRNGCIYVSEYGRIRKIDTNGIINTIAGNGILGYSGDGSAATLASFVNEAITIDKWGNLYIGDSQYGVIRKVDTQGIISTFAGSGIVSNLGDNGPASSAGLTKISCLTNDTNGNLYVGCGPYPIIRVIRPSGYIYRFAGCDTTIPGGFSGDGGMATDAHIGEANGIAVNKAGEVFFSDRRNQRIRKIDTNGRISTYAGSGTVPAGSILGGGFSGDGGPATLAKLHDPRGIAIDDSDNVYIADRTNSCVRKVSKNGQLVSVPFAPKFHVTIFPNPLIDCDYLNINNVVDKSAYRIVSLTGELLLSGQLVKGDNQISFHSFVHGIYILELEGRDGQSIREIISKL